MKNSIKILLLVLCITSCSGDENIPENPLVTKVFSSVVYQNLMPNNDNDSKFSFEYDSKLKVTKKTGGVLSSAAATGFNGIFSEKIHTSLIYSSNIVTVEDFSTSTEFDVFKNTRYFTLNSQKQITSKEITNKDPYLSKKQTFNYVNNKLSEIKTVFPNIPNSSESNGYLLTYLEKFYYDTNDNLTKTECFEQRNGVNAREKIVRTFEDYDNAINPFKRFQLIDDFFYRSLSKNNYKKYTEIHYYDNSVSSSNITVWSFDYDSKGQIIIN